MFVNYSPSNGDTQHYKRATKNTFVSHGLGIPDLQLRMELYFKPANSICIKNH